jgi:hypothetical protein
MTNSPPPSLEQALHIHSRFAVELTFVVPGEKTGLLPINSLLVDLENLLNQDVPEHSGHQRAGKTDDFRIHRRLSQPHPFTLSARL